MRKCKCGCGGDVPEPPPGKRGRPQEFAEPACRGVVPLARLAGWTPSSELTPLVFLNMRRAALRFPESGPQEAAIDFTNHRACKCGCGRPAVYAEGCEARERRRAR